MEDEQTDQNAETEEEDSETDEDDETEELTLEEKVRAARTRLIPFYKLIPKGADEEILDGLYNPWVRKANGGWEYHGERKRGETVLEKIVKEEQNEQLHQALSRLQPSDKLIIQNRFGIYTTEWTLQEIADMKGCTREAVRTKIERTLKRLREDLD